MRNSNFRWPICLEVMESPLRVSSEITAPAKTLSAPAVFSPAASIESPTASAVLVYASSHQMLGGDVHVGDGLPPSKMGSYSAD